MTFNILTDAKVRASTSSKSLESRPYSIIWDVNRDLKGWTTFVNMDVVGSWSGFLYGTKTTGSGSFIGPSSDIVPAIDATLAETAIFRMKYDKHPKNGNPTTAGKVAWITQDDPVFDAQKEISFNIIPDGSWNVYEVLLGDHPGWVGNITRIRFFPCEDGGINDDFFLSFFELGSTKFSLSFENPDAGTPGFFIGESDVASEVVITRNLNDKIIVNIDNYGDVELTLTPGRFTPAAIARDLSLQMAKVNSGGYIRAWATLENNRIKIESGTRAEDSSVVVKLGSNSAAPVLGFIDGFGNIKGISSNGTDPVSFFEPLCSYSPTTLEILSLFDSSFEDASFSLDPQQYVVEGGRSDFAVIFESASIDSVPYEVNSPNEISPGRKITLDATNKTIIDLNHPFSDDGKLNRLFINAALAGRFDYTTPGFPEPEDVPLFSKWKIFRPKLDGSLVLVSEGSIGELEAQNPSGGTVYSTRIGIGVEDLSSLNVRVRKGDLLGVFNAQFSFGTGLTKKVDALYYLLDGDVSGTFTPPTPQGAGEAGLPLYARGSILKDRVVLDVDFGKRLNLNKAILRGKENTRDLEYNIATATSATANAEVQGEHTVCFEVISNLRICVPRSNFIFNTHALNDGLRLAENGLSSFNRNDSRATYFYASGDEEFLLTFDSLRDQAPTTGGFLLDPVGIDILFSSTSPRMEKKIGKAIMYFKDKKNMRSWQIETSLGDFSKGGNGSKSGFQLIPELSIFSVKIDNTLIERDSGEILVSPREDMAAKGHILLRNPNINDPIQNGVRNLALVNKGLSEQIGTIDNVEEQLVFVNLQWNTFEWNFEPIRTTAFRWFCDSHYSTKISELEVYAVSESNNSLADNLQIELSPFGESFGRAELESSNENSAMFKLGGSPQFMRLTFRPTFEVDINELEFQFETDQISFGQEGRLDSLSIQDAQVGKVGQATPLIITNSLGERADLIVDIPSEFGTTDQLMYFSRLNGVQDITSPQYGPPGKVDFDEDKVLFEEENIAINCKAYGLKNIAGILGSVSDNLITNGSFETGDLSGWELVSISSGTQHFSQVPRVVPIEEGVTTATDGVFSYGIFNTNDNPTHSGVVGQSYRIKQNVSVSGFSTLIDAGTATFDLLFDYNLQGAHPSRKFSYRVSKLDVNNQVIGSVENGSLSQPTSGFDTASFLDKPLPVGTRSIILDFTVESPTPVVVSSAQFGLVDNVRLSVKSLTNDSMLKWYKSYKTGTGDFTDTRFSPIVSFTNTIASTHWYQPFTESGSNPNLSQQNQGFSNIFSNNRLDFVESGRRAKVGDEAFFAAQWSGEKEIVGFRVSWAGDNTGVDLSHPKRFKVEALKSDLELESQFGIGTIANINNPDHFKVVQIYSSQGSLGTGTGFQGTSLNNVPSRKRLSVYLLDSSVITRALKIVIDRACDFFELSLNPFWPNFEDGTPCQNSAAYPDGLVVSKFAPLEKINVNNLPVDNLKSAHDTSVGTVFAAVDLGRIYAIDSDPNVFELLNVARAGAPLWTAANAVFSDTDTSDPNAVVWSSTRLRARWIRFAITATNEYEEDKFDSSGGDNSVPEGLVSSYPQTLLVGARIYPDITINSFPVVGFNTTWDSLGTALSDSDLTTFVSAFDYPIVALDFGRKYLLSNSNVVQGLGRKRKFFVDRPLVASDTFFWDQDDDDVIAYSIVDISDPKKAVFGSYGAGVLDQPIRWVGIKSVANIQTTVSSVPFFRRETNGQKLLDVEFRPRQVQVITENSNFFSTEQTSLVDISTISLDTTSNFVEEEFEDFGASHNNLGTPFFAFDGVFDAQTKEDFWGVKVRDQDSGLNNPDFDFPHFIWRTFRNRTTRNIESRTISSLFVLGFSEEFYPKEFKFQKLRSGEDPNSESSWVDIESASFTDIDSYNDGNGFTFLLPTPAITEGIRLYITDSQFPDDTQEKDVESSFVSITGPQTRVVAFRIYEKSSSSAQLTGFIENNHMLSADVSSLSSVPDKPVSSLKDGLVSTTWRATGFTDKISIQLAGTFNISKLEWELNSVQSSDAATGSVEAPQDFILRAKINGEFVEVLNIVDFVGQSFSQNINPVSSSEFEFEILKPQGIEEFASGIQISELRLIEVVQQIIPLIQIRDSLNRRPESPNSRSTQVEYAANATIPVSVKLTGLDSNNDPIFSERDFFTLWIYINNVSLLDRNFGFIKLGNTSSKSYTWNIAEFKSMLNTGWNEVKLQFKEASDKSEYELVFQGILEPNIGFSKVDFKSGDSQRTWASDGTSGVVVEEGPGISYFEFSFRGLGGSEALIIDIDDFKFIRNRFDDICKFSPSLYLNNSEILFINLNGIDTTRGSVDFWIRPDWDFNGQIAAFTGITPGIFRIIHPDGTFLVLLFRPSQGFVLLINDGFDIYQYVPNMDSSQIQKDQAFHFAVSWDHLGRIDAQKHTVVMYLNGSLIYESFVSWRAKKNPTGSVLVGGEVGQLAASPPQNPTAQVFLPTNADPVADTASAWALIENLKIYNFPRTDFSDRLEQDVAFTKLTTPDQLIQISKDNIEFHSVGSSGLPFLFPGIDPGESATLYVRTNIPKGLTGQERRDASLLVRWRTPLVVCD